MKFNLSYLFLFLALLNISCDKEESGRNQLSEDQLRHLVGISTSYIFNTPETFNTELVYGQFTEIDTTALNLTVVSQTSEEQDFKFRPAERTNVIGTSTIDLTGKSILKEAKVTMKGSSSLLGAELGITTTVDTLFFYCNLNTPYNQPYTDFINPLASVTVLNVVYENVYVFDQSNAEVLGIDFQGFKEVYFAKDYGFIKIEMDIPTEEEPVTPPSSGGELVTEPLYKLQLLTYFEIPGLQGPISSTGVAAYQHVDAPVGNQLLTNQDLYLLVEREELGDGGLVWGEVYKESVNAVRQAYSDGSERWNEFLTTTIQLTDEQIVKYELSYNEVKQQVFDLTNSTANPPSLTLNASLALGAYKWNRFYLSHFNSTSTSDIYATKLGGTFSSEDSLSIHGDFENLLGFELSTSEEKGKLEQTTPKGKQYGDPTALVRLWLIDDAESTANGGVYKNRVFMLNPNHKEVGSYGNSTSGVAVVRVLE